MHLKIFIDIAVFRIVLDCHATVMDFRGFSCFRPHYIIAEAVILFIWNEISQKNSQGKFNFGACRKFLLLFSTPHRFWSPCAEPAHRRHCSILFAATVRRLLVRLVWPGEKFSICRLFGRMRNSLWCRETSHGTEAMVFRTRGATRRGNAVKYIISSFVFANAEVWNWTMADVVVCCWFFPHLFFCCYLEHVRAWI